MVQEVNKYCNLDKPCSPVLLSAEGKRTVAIMLLGFILCAKSFSAGYTGIEDSADTLLTSRIGEYMNMYFESFTVSDEHGKYDPGKEFKFAHLFEQDALIFNFLPDQKNSYQPISIDEYFATVRNHFSDKIIRPGLYTWHIQSLSPMREDHQYLIHAVIQKRVIIYQQDDMAVQSIDDWELRATFLADTQQDSLKIIGIHNLLNENTDLTLRVLYPSREPAKWKTFEIEYFDPALRKRVKRERVTNQLGLLSLSHVSSKSRIKIHSADKHENLLSAALAADNWNHLTGDNRFFIIQETPPFERKRKHHLVNAGTKLHFPFNPFDISLGLNSPATLSKIGDLHQTDFFAHYSRMFFLWKGLGLAASSGLEYAASAFTSSGNQLAYLFSPVNTEAVARVDTSIVQIAGEKYKHTLLGIPLTVSVNYVSQNRVFTGAGIGVRARYAIINKYNYTLQFNENTPGDAAVIPDFYIRNETGSFSQAGRFDFSLDLSLLFNIYRDILHLHTMASYNLNTVGNQRKNNSLTDDPADIGAPFPPFFNDNKLEFYNITMGLGLAYRF